MESELEKKFLVRQIPKDYKKHPHNFIVQRYIGELERSRIALESKEINKENNKNSLLGAIPRLKPAVFRFSLNREFLELKTVGLKSELLNPPVFNKYALAIPAIDTVAARCIELKLAEPQYNELTELMADEGLTGESIENKGILEAIVRKIDDRDYFLTIKSKCNEKRRWCDLNISKDAFGDLWCITKFAMLEKMRYKIPHNDLALELDVYEGRLDILVAVNVKFVSEEALHQFVPLDWFGREVTADENYKDIRLAQYGIPAGYEPPKLFF